MANSERQKYETYDHRISGRNTGLANNTSFSGDEMKKPFIGDGSFNIKRLLGLPAGSDVHDVIAAIIKLKDENAKLKDHLSMAGISLGEKS